MPSPTFSFKSKEGVVETWEQLGFIFSVSEKNTFKCHVRKPNQLTQVREVFYLSTQIVIPFQFEANAPTSFDKPSYKTNNAISLSKNYYKINEVAEILDIRSTTMRFWMQNINALKVKKIKNRISYFSQEEVYFFNHIKTLIQKEGFTMEQSNAQLIKHRTYYKNFRQHLSNLIHLKHQIEKML